MIDLLKQCRLLCLLLLSIFFVSCSDDPDFDGSQEGSLILNISGNKTVLTKSAGEDVNDYEIVISMAEQPYAHFRKFSEMPEPYRLPVGDYQIKAFWGENPDIAYDSPFYEGMESFTIAGDAETSVTVTCYLANTKLTFSVSDNFESVFSDYNVIITTPYCNEENAFIVSKGNIENEVFLRPGDIKLTLDLVKKSNGVRYKYGLPLISGVEPRHHYKVQLNTASVGTGITILIDEVETEKVEVIELTEDNLIRESLFIEPSFDVSEPVIVPSGQQVLNSMAVLIKSDQGIKELILNIEGPEEEMAHLDIPMNIKFSEMTQELAGKLNEWGINWTDGVLDTSVCVIRFTELQKNLQLLPGDITAEYKFSLEVMDNKDNIAGLPPFIIRVIPTEP